MEPKKKALHLKKEMPKKAMALIKRMIKRYDGRYDGRYVHRARLGYWVDVRNEYWKLLGIKRSEMLPPLKKGPNSDTVRIPSSKTKTSFIIPDMSVLPKIKRDLEDTLRKYEGVSKSTILMHQLRVELDEIFKTYNIKVSIKIEVTGNEIKVKPNSLDTAMVLANIIGS